MITSSAFCGGDIILLRPAREFHAYFLGYLLDCRPIADQKAVMGRGITVMHIYGAQIRHLSLALPPLSEQIAIARFLEHVDRRIRRYVHAKEKLIALLEEQKQAVVHEAVTGRIDVRTGQPYPAYKPSRVEWLGDVPAHWRVLPLKRIGSFGGGVGFPVSEQGRSEEEVLFAKVSDMNRPGNDREILSAANSVSLETARNLGAKVFEQNTIIFPKVGGAMLTNKRRIIIRPTCIDNNVMACMVTGADIEFSFRLFTLLDLGRMSKPGPVPAIGEGEVREIRIALPPPTEQTCIVFFLNDRTTEIDNTIDRTRRQINLFSEYRTRLIADVVTGKIDVREAAAALPEVDPLADDDEADAPLEAGDESAFGCAREPASVAT